MEHKIHYERDLTSLSNRSKLAHMEKLERHKISGSKIPYKGRWIIGKHYFFRLRYVHTNVSQKEATMTQPTRSKMDTMYDRYVQDRTQGHEFISERRELLWSRFIGLCSFNIEASRKKQEATFDLLSRKDAEIRKIFNL